MCGPDGRTSINGVPVWWCDGPYCREHSEPVHTCAVTVVERGYVLALSPDKTLKLQQAVADLPVVGVDSAVVASAPRMLSAADREGEPLAEGEIKLAAWGLQYEMIDEPLAESDGDVIDEPTTPVPSESADAPLVDEEGETHATDDNTD